MDVKAKLQVTHKHKSTDESLGNIGYFHRSLGNDYTSRAFFVLYVSRGYSSRSHSYKGDSVPVNSVSSRLAALACHVLPGFAGFIPAGHVTARGEACPGHLFRADWLADFHHPALSLYARHSDSCLGGLGVTLWASVGVNILP